MRRNGTAKTALSTLAMASALAGVGLTSSAVSAQEDDYDCVDCAEAIQPDDITATSVGYISLGNTVAQAREEAPELNFVRGYGSENSLVIDAMDGDTTVLVIWADEGVEWGEDGTAPAIVENAVIHSIEVLVPRYFTWRGVHVGMSVSDAEEQYGTLVEMFNLPHLGEMGTFEDQPDGLEFLFEPAEGEATAGIYEEMPNCPDDTYPPLCRPAVGTTPGAFISKITVRGFAEEAMEEGPQIVRTISDGPNGLEATLVGPTECSNDENGNYTGDGFYQLSYNAGETQNYQEITVRGAAPCLDEMGEESIAPETVAYADQTGLIYADFTFDGEPDLAFFEGMNGGYGFPAYQVHLYSPDEGNFVYSPEFTRLARYQGMFRIEDDEQMIYNETRSGCCYYETEGFRVVDNELVKVLEEVKEYTGPGQYLSTTRRLADGDWVTTVEERTEEEAE